MTNATKTTDIELILEWFGTFEEHINARDYDAARELFDGTVIGFGTRVPVAQGLDELEQDQWRRTWDRIEDFRFDLDSTGVTISNDPAQGTAFGTWSSLGIRADGTRFERAGRVTMIFVQDPLSGSWKAVHTHFSENPRVAG